jgi:hypothetical protein
VYSGGCGDFISHKIGPFFGPLTRDFAFGDIPARLRRALQRAETKKVRALALTFFIPSLCGE